MNLGASMTKNKPPHKDTATAKMAVPISNRCGVVLARVFGGFGVRAVSVPHIVHPVVVFADVELPLSPWMVPPPVAPQAWALGATH